MSNDDRYYGHAVIKDITTGKEYKTYSEAGKDLGIHRSNAMRCCSSNWLAYTTGKSPIHKCAGDHILVSDMQSCQNRCL